MGCANGKIFLPTIARAHRTTITRSTHYRALSPDSCILLRYHAQPRVYTALRSIHLSTMYSLEHLLNLSEISNHDPSSFVKYRNSFRIRLDYFVPRFSAIFFLPFSFFLFLSCFFDRDSIKHVAPIKHLSCRKNVYRILFFFFSLPVYAAC